MIEPLQAGIEKEAFSNGERIFAKNGNYCIRRQNNENGEYIFWIEDIKKLLERFCKK